jgi:protein-tyrosine phosphatase
VLAAVEQFRIRLEEAEIPLDVYPGSELVVDSDLPERIESNELLTVNDNHAVALIETPVDIIPHNLERFFWSMQSSGVDIVLAHPERNFQVIKNPSLLLEWIQKGIMVQITASAIAGRMGQRVGDFCISLLERRMVHLVASDSHSPKRRRPLLSGARSVVESVVGKDEAHKIFYENPKLLLQGIVPDLAPPIESLKKTSFLRRIFAFRS